MEILEAREPIQQSQIKSPKVAQKAPLQTVQELQKVQITEQESSAKTQKASSQEQTDKLVEQLNRSLDPFNTSVRFGFDNSSKDFYVFVIENQNHRVLRRFPEEQAEQLLPKMKKIAGLLFDLKA